MRPRLPSFGFFTVSVALLAAGVLVTVLPRLTLVPRLLGFRGGVALGPFTFIPDLFASVATVVLLYQSNK